MSAPQGRAGDVLARQVASAATLVRRAVGQALLGAVAAAVVGFAAMPADAQPARPHATVTAVPPSGSIAAGSTVTLRLRVELPTDVHVQAHEPRDPLLVPTVATLQPPSGTRVESVVYPAPSEYRQAGASEPLLVLGPSFDLDVRVAVSADVTAGALTVPVVLRYQACNATTCFPPARAHKSWRLEVAGR